MKKSFLILVASACMTAAVATSCSSPAEKVETAQENVNDANADLAKANQEYLTDIENYRKETAAKIIANDQSIAEFKKRSDLQKKEAKEEYNKKIAALELKNREMQAKMDSYQASGKDKWESFKTEFNHDMEELGKGFNDFTVNNVK